MNLKNIYNNQLHERYNNPKYKQMLKEFSFQSGIYNPSCGDKINIQVVLHKGKIINVGYQSEGCVISSGTADLLADFFINKNIIDVTTISKEDIFSIIGMNLGPNRLRCAYITIEALQNIYQQYTNRADRA